MDVQGKLEIIISEPRKIIIQKKIIHAAFSGTETP